MWDPQRLLPYLQRDGSPPSVGSLPGTDPLVASVSTSSLRTPLVSPLSGSDCEQI